MVGLRKKALWLLVSLMTFALLSSLQTNVAKASATKVSLDYYGKPGIVDSTLVPGSTFTFNVTVDYVELLWGYQFKLGEPAWWELNHTKYQGWNASILQLLAVENGPFLGSQRGNVVWLPGEINNTQGTLSLTGAVLDPKMRFPTGGGTLASLTFQVVGYGSSPIHFGLDTALLNRSNGFGLGPDWGLYRGTLNPDFLVDGYFNNRPKVRVDPLRVVAVPVGEAFTVNIDAIDIIGLNNWVFSLRWNYTILSITGVTEGDFLKSVGATTFSPGEINMTSGEITDISASLTTTAEVDGSGTLVSITFAVLAEGTSELALFNAALRDSAGDMIPVETIDGFFTNLRFHNIEITSVSHSPVKVKAGSNDTIHIDVIVTNVGSYNETGINVSAYYSENEIGTVQNISLSGAANRALTFEWDTTGIPSGIYTISVNASSVPEEEIITDNTKQSVADAVVWLHDIAVTSVSTPVGNVFSGRSVNVTVVVTNRGTEIEAFNVTAYYDGNEIGTANVTNLGYKESRGLRLEWDTTGLELGEYTISAEASFVEGEDEEDRDNNVCVKTGKINIIFFEEEPLSTAFLILISLPFVIIGVAAILFVRRRKTAEL